MVHAERVARLIEAKSKRRAMTRAICQNWKRRRIEAPIERRLRDEIPARISMKTRLGRRDPGSTFARETTLPVLRAGTDNSTDQSRRRDHGHAPAACVLLI